MHANMFVGGALLAVIASLVGAVPAFADRTGHAPIRAPKKLDSIHVEFTLPGGPWGQLVGALAGTPRYGSYAYDVPMPSGYTCRIAASVRATATRFYPHVGRRSVRMRPVLGGSELLRFERQGRHGTVRWWSGTLPHDAAAAGGVQRAPARLRKDGWRWLVYQMDVQSRAAPADEDACHERARRTGRRTVRRIAMSLKLADGPPISEAPFAVA